MLFQLSASSAARLACAVLFGLWKMEIAGRERVAEIFATWWEHHRDIPVRAADLDVAVKALFMGKDGQPIKPNALGRDVQRLEGQRQSFRTTPSHYASPTRRGW